MEYTHFDDLDDFYWIFSHAITEYALDPYDRVTDALNVSTSYIRRYFDLSHYYFDEYLDTLSQYYGDNY